MQDRDLLREYLLNHSEPAFAELVGRHVNLVFSCARRVVRDDALAKDVTQAVFIHLANKAHTVRDGDALAGWLYRATCNTATSAVRSESRRRLRENEAMNLAELEKSARDAWMAVAPLLDEAMQRLSADEQDAVVLRYFEGRSLREVGIAQNLSDDAAQKRISRALDKIRLYFSRHGVTVSVAVFASLLAAHSVTAAPVGLASGVVGPAFAVAGGVAAKGMVGKLLAHKIKLAILSVAAAGSIVAAVIAWQSRSNLATVLGNKPVPSAPKPPFPRADVLGQETFEAPINFPLNGNAARFSLHTTQATAIESVTVVADGTVTASADGFYVEYSIDCQIYGSLPLVPGQLPGAKDEINIESSAVLKPDVPFVLWRSKNKTIVMQTDDQEVTLQIVQPNP